MKTYLVLLLFLLAHYSMVAKAHGDHSQDSESGRPELNEETARIFAVRSIHKMTIRDFGFGAGKLDKSWLSIRAKDLVINNSEGGLFVYSVKSKSGGESLIITLDSIGKPQSASLKK